MFKKDLGELREEKMCSPLAIAVCTGDARLVATLLTQLNDVEVDFGYEVTQRTPAPLRTNMFANKRKRTPL